MSRPQANPTARDYREASKERSARERGKALPHYTRKVTRELLRPRSAGEHTPSKRGK